MVQTRSFAALPVLFLALSCGVAIGQIDSLEPPVVAHDHKENLFTDAQEQEIQRRIEDAVRSQAIVRKPGLAYGYQNGFFLQSPEGVKREKGSVFELRINSWMQFRHTALDSHTSNPSQNDFEFERLRLTFQGNVYSPDVRYFVQLDGDSDQGAISDWLDYYVSADLGHAAGCRKGSFGIRVGQWKLPFNRTRAESGWKLQFSDRSVASVFFDINRSQAVGLFGNLGFLGRTVNWETAISNGFKTGGARVFRSGELDRNFGYSARLWTDWFGEWGSDGEADLSYHEDVAMRVGGGFAHTRLDRSGVREFASQRVVDSGQILATILPASTRSYDFFLYSVDANWKYRGGSLLTEFYFRKLDNFDGGFDGSLFDHGYLIQAGRFVIREKLEFLARWSRIQGNSGTLGAQDQSSDEVAAGLVWYLRGNRAKLTFDATRLNGAPIRDAALNIMPGDDGMLYRTQFQLYF